MKTLIRLVIVSLLAVPELSRAVEIAPATAADIMAALGPDARGLSIRQDDLPDLFTLTSSRIDENSARFLIEQPYLDGRWKDGKAIIEYARDLSYTLVSIYDKAGKRQRIYSVRTKFIDHVARAQAQEELDRQEAPAVDADELPPTRPAKRSRKRETPEVREAREPSTSRSKKSTPTSPVAESSADSAQAGGYVWDEAKSEYIYVGPEEMTESVVEESKPEPSKPSRSRREVEVAQRPPKEEVPAPVVQKEEADVPSPQRSKRRRLRRLTETEVAQTSEGSAPAVTVGGTTWVERSEVKPIEEAAAPLPPKSERISMVPSKEETSATRRALRDQEERAKEQEEAIRREAAHREESRREEARREETRREETRREEARKERNRRREESVAVKPGAPGTVVDIDAVAALPSASPKEIPAGLNETQVPSTEELLADAEKPATPLTSESDSWVPKAVSKPAVVDAVPEKTEVKQVAMLPKKAAPVDNSVENLLKMAAQSKTVTREGDAWVPRKEVVAAPPATEANFNKEIQRIRKEEKERATVVRRPIKKDVNNPEEGVLPVSSFEKMTGPMFGRHREYERRFFPGKKAKSKAPDHDFYVDEVDRKKEIHNVYFYRYQKGKAPKLVAVQKHDNVSFRSNYDIDKEDKGKISVY